LKLPVRTMRLAMSPIVRPSRLMRVNAMIDRRREEATRTVSSCPANTRFSPAGSGQCTRTPANADVWLSPADASAGDPRLATVHATPPMTRRRRPAAFDLSVRTTAPQRSRLRDIRRKRRIGRKRTQRFSARDGGRDVRPRNGRRQRVRSFGASVMPHINRRAPVAIFGIGA
jgi:hypothetical protein